MRFNRRFSSRGWGTVALGIVATAIAIANPSREGVQTAAGCGGERSESDEWLTIERSGATETWSRDGFHYWVGVPIGWEEGLPASLEDLPDTQVEVTDDQGQPVAGQLGMYKIRRQSVVLTWRAAAELPVGSTLHSSLALVDGDPYPRVQVLTVADSTTALELPTVNTEGWVTETWTEGAAAECPNEGCTRGIRVDEVSALTWRLGWNAPIRAPWSFEIVVTQGRAIKALGPNWVGHSSWARGGVGLHLLPAEEYCFKVVATDFSSDTTLSSEETCSAPGTPEDEVFLDLDGLLDCVDPPEHEGLRERWCDHNPEHEACQETNDGTGGSAGTSGNTTTDGSAGTSGNTTTGGSAGTSGTTGGSAGTSGSGGSGQPAASGGDAAVAGADDDKARLSTGSCWCSVPQGSANGHTAVAFVGLVLLGWGRRRAS